MLKHTSTMDEHAEIRDDEDPMSDDDMVGGDGDEGEPVDETKGVDEDVADLVESIEPDSDDDVKSVAEPVADDDDDDEVEADVDDDEKLKARTNFVLVDRTQVQLHKDVMRVPNEKRITSDIMSQAEMTEAISIRCSQIAQNAVIMVDITGMSVDDPIVIAKMEISARRCPLILRRVIYRLSDRKTGAVTDVVEDWDINEMIYPASVKLPATNLERLKK